MSNIVKWLGELAPGVKWAVTINYATFSFKSKPEQMCRSNQCRDNLHSCTAPTNSMIQYMMPGPHTPWKTHFGQWTAHIIQHQYIEVVYMCVYVGTVWGTVQLQQWSASADQYVTWPRLPLVHVHVYMCVCECDVNWLSWASTLPFGRP